MAAWSSATSGNISGVMTVASAGIRFGGTTTSRLSPPTLAASAASVGVVNSAHVGVQPRPPHPLGQRHRQQRVTPELEEVVLPAHLLDREHLGPQPRQRLLDLALRRLVPARAISALFRRR
jgi:hypothetical protein